MQTVREFSPAGPCLMLGELVRKTAKTLTYIGRADNVTQRRGGRKVETNYIHTEPCISCRDHPQTQYPEGYMD